MNQLAIHGGDPVFPEGSPSWPLRDEAVAAALQETLRDGSWGRYHGPHTDRLAQLLAEMHAVDHVTLCASGTVAVELALRGLRVGPGHEVVLAGYDFPGNFRAIEAVGAHPVLIDIDPATWCLNNNLEDLDAATRPNTRAIIVSHLHGGTADMSTLIEFSQRRGLAIVEDACQSPGAHVGARIAGTWGDIGVLSFGGSKLITAGRGGAILTANPEIHQRIKIYSERGNEAFPLSQMQAAVIIPQWMTLSERNHIRSKNVQRLHACLQDVDALTPVRPHTEDDEPSFYKLAWRLSSALSPDCQRSDFITAFHAEGLAIDAGFRGFTRRSAQRCRKVGSLRHAQRAAETTLLLHHPVLLQSPDVIGRVAEGIEKVTKALIT